MEIKSTKEPKVKIICSKLVRDNMVDIIESKGSICNLQYLNDEKSQQKGKFIIHLKKKLLEESKEVVRTENRQDLMSELCDVYEVFRCLMKFYKLDFGKLLGKYYKQNYGTLNDYVFVTNVTISNDNTQHLEMFEKMGKQIKKDDNSTTFTINKLLFDDFMEKNKYTYETKTIDDKMICYELKRLLVDVSRNVLNDHNIIESLGKVYMVLSKILIKYNMEFSQLIESTDEKLATNGGFDKCILLQSIIVDKNSESFNELSKKYKWVDVE